MFIYNMYYIYNIYIYREKKIVRWSPKWQYIHDVDNEPHRSVLKCGAYRVPTWSPQKNEDLFSRENIKM